MELGSIGTFSGRTQNSYIPTERTPRPETEEVVTPSEWTPENPYTEQGIDTTTWTAYYEASKYSSPLVQNDLAQKLFAQSGDTPLTDRITDLTQKTKSVDKNTITKAIQFENNRLAALRQPPMSPGEEQKFIRLIQQRAREELVVLGNFATALAAQRFEPFDAAA